MLETSQPLVRAFALVAATALFAGIWANDRPQAAPAPRSIATRSRHSALGEKPAAQPASTMTVSLGTVSRTWTIDADALLIPASRFDQHVAQLPVGLPSGDYRIVDSLGGVGWLHVRSQGAVNLPLASSPLLTTLVEGEPVRFIRIVSAAIGTQAGGVSR
jgi:hypothetical protein